MQIRLQPEHDPLQQQRCLRALRLCHRRALRVPQAAQQLAALRIDDRDWIGESGRCRGQQLEVEFSKVRLWPADLGDPLGDALLSLRRQRVDLAIRAVRAAGGSLAHHLASLLQPGQRDVDLPVVHRVTERAECLAQPGPQLVAVRRFFGQQREHDFLLHLGIPTNGYLANG